jgi:alkaline phosphatase
MREFMKPAPLLVACAAGVLLFPILDSMAPRAAHARTRNVILCVGDGMGFSCITGARLLRGEREKLDHTGRAELFLDTLNRTGKVRTYSLDNLVTDSAAGITAMMCGEKTRNGWLGMVPSAEGPSRNVETLLELAESQGRSTGVVTNTRITHATPAGGYAHGEDRDAELEIARQVVPAVPGYNGRLRDGVEVLLGGGRQKFLPKELEDEEGVAGDRADGADLLSDLIQAGYTYVWNRQQLLAIDTEATPRLLGLFASDHMSYEDQRGQGLLRDPSLVEMATTAVRVLRNDPDGFFLLLESGRIDHALHDNRGIRALNEMLMFDETIRALAELLPEEETLLVVTSDHEHAFTILGYPKPGEGITGVAGRDADGNPYPALAFGSGPGERIPGGSPGGTSEYGSEDFVHPAAVRLASGAHGGTDVPALAWGKTAQAERIAGTLENTDIFRILEAALREN